MTIKDKEVIDNLFRKKNKLERNKSRIKNIPTIPTRILINVLEQKENSLIGNEFDFDDKESIDIISELLNALIMKDDVELDRVKEEIKNIKIMRRCK